MWPYWLLFALPLLGVLAPRSLPPRQSRLVWMVVGLLVALMLGLRFEVGGDWFAYLPIFLDASTLTFMEVLGQGDPAYYLLNWLVAKAGGGIYMVNFLCAAVLVWGTIVFCRAGPNPWLAMLAAVPYLLVVVGMGYTRQSVALGFALLALTALGKGRVRGFVGWIVAGAFFHKSAVLMLPIAALSATRNRIWIGLLIALISALVYYLLLQASVESLWTNYVDAEMESQGGAIRVAMNAVPALLLLLFRRRLVPDRAERKLWLWIAVFALLCIPLVGLASTAVDRVALYFIPLQLYVFARVPRLATTTRMRTPLVLAICAYYAAVLFVWMHYAEHAQYWLPYQFRPWD
jgi:hypothetical protein